MSTTKLRYSTTTLRCFGCGQEKPVDQFALKKDPYADGTPRYKSRCQVCLRAYKRTNTRRDGVKRIENFDAPLAAAVALMKAKPEILNEVIRKYFRYRNDYMPYLTQERTRLLTAYKNLCEANHNKSK